DSGNIYVADTAGNRIRLVTPNGGIRTIAGTGEPGFAGDGGAAIAARLNGPAGLFLDSGGTLYFADSGNDRVRRLVPDVSFVVAVPAVTVANALSGVGGAVEPGETVSVTAVGIGPGVALWFDAVAAPLLFAEPGRIT